MGFKQKLAYISLSCVILLSGIAPFTNAQAPEETRIVFESRRRLIGLSEIYIMDTDGNNEHPLMKEAPGNEQFPAWSPDGKTIAFTSNRDGGGGSALVDIYLVDLEKDKELGLKDGNPRNITNNPALDHYPAWSPDGKSIAFQSNRDKNWEIYVVNADGENPRRLTSNRAADTTPAWSPDGREIAFVSARDGNLEVYLMDRTGNNQHNITNHAFTDTNPSWAPSGNKITFSSYRDDSEEIYVMDADGKNQRNITNNPSLDSNPAWSPDGKSIAFQSNRDGNLEIYVMDTDGNNQRRLTRKAESDKNPAWFDPRGLSVSPGGKFKATWGGLKQKIE